MTGLNLILGGQYGAEAKHLYSQYLSQINPPKLTISLLSPEQKHSIYFDNDPEQRLWLYHLPASCLYAEEIHIARGSIVDPELLDEELKQLEQYRPDIRDRIYIDANTPLITKYDNGIETITAYETDNIFSARASDLAYSKIIQKSDYMIANNYPIHAELGINVDKDIRFRSLSKIRAADLRKEQVMIEAPYGFGVSFYTGEYPYTISRATDALGVLTMSGLPLSVTNMDLKTHVIFRTFPIKPAGKSGNLSNEVDWNFVRSTAIRGGADVPDLTEINGTTKQSYRVGLFDHKLFLDAIMMNNATKIIFTYVNYLDWSLYKKHLDMDDFISNPFLREFMNSFQAYQTAFAPGKKIEVYFSTSPYTEHISGPFLVDFSSGFITFHEVNAVGLYDEG